MSSQTMNITLSTSPADPRWGEQAIISINDKGVIIHLSDSDPLTIIARAARKIAEQRFADIALGGKGWDLERSWAFMQGYYDPKNVSQIRWPELSKQERQELESRHKVMCWVRHTINEPAENLGPEQLVCQVVDLLSEVAADAVTWKIIKGDDLREWGYKGIHTVGRGSSRPPVLLTLDYNPTGREDEPVFACLVGKGITFDTGGYNLKPGSTMDSMRSDMGGAAMVSGALALAIYRGLQKRVKLLLCCADNMVSGNAMRPSDIINYRNNKTVEIMNTDAEGRLVLADGLIDASLLQPELLIDAATLTGAAKVALGNDYHALFTFDDALAQKLLESAAIENELFWRLPLAEFHRTQTPSDFADLSNIASGAHLAGASTAAAFLSHFVQHYQKGWLHIDCSATWRKTAVNQWAAGATGLGVRTLANLLLK